MSDQICATPGCGLLRYHPHHSDLPGCHAFVPPSDADEAVDADRNGVRALVLLSDEWTPEELDAMARIFAAGRRAGARDMKERAAGVAHETQRLEAMRKRKSCLVMRAAGRIRDTITALEIK